MRTLQPPEQIEDKYFMVVWDPVEDIYLLSLKDGRSFELGTADRAMIYFRNVLNLEVLGERALDSARNWKVSAVLPSENRCFGVDAKDERTEFQRLFDIEPEHTLIV